MSHTNLSTDLKQACVQAAHEVIAEKGIDQLSLRDVARKLGVSHQAPYRHFASKTHLLAAVIARCFRDFAGFLDQRQHQADPLDDLAAMGAQYVSYAMQHPLEYQLMFGSGWPGCCPPGEAEAQLNADPELIRDALHAFNLLREALGRLHGNTKAAKEKRDLDALFVWSTMHGLVSIVQCNAMQDLQLPAKLQAKVPQHVFAMIRAALAARLG